MASLKLLDSKTSGNARCFVVQAQGSAGFSFCCCAGDARVSVIFPLFLRVHKNI
jgi:hypothetical protein